MKHETIVADCLALVAPAETAFRSRWRMSTLRKRDPDLADAVAEQDSLYNAALVTGSAQEARMQAEAMVRGWRAACASLEAPLAPDDAYLVGYDFATGLRVVVSDYKASVGRVQAMKDEHGNMGKVIMVTPDEVAAMFAGLQILAGAKSAFPDAEIVQVAP